MRNILWINRSRNMSCLQLVKVGQVVCLGTILKLVPLGFPHYMNTVCLDWKMKTRSLFTLSTFSLPYVELDNIRKKIRLLRSFSIYKRSFFAMKYVLSQLPCTYILRWDSKKLLKSRDSNTTLMPDFF